MATGYILTNQKAGNGNYAKDIASLNAQFKEPLVFMDVAKIEDYQAFLSGLEADDFLVLTGGDGTLHHFANDTAGLQLPRRVLYYPTGTGNDFARELGKSYGEPPFEIRNYLTNLPKVEVQGKSRYFLNGIGFGIDGYYTEVGDRLREQGKKKINYTRIAIQGLLWGFPPVAAKITVDGEVHTYNKVWIARPCLANAMGAGCTPPPIRTGRKRTRCFL